jgi:hypothetical protein
MRTYTKAEVLRAMRQTLSEYENHSHECNVGGCSMCQLFHDYSNKPHECVECPLYAFYGQGKVGSSYPCMNRNAFPRSIHPSNNLTYINNDYKVNGELKIRTKKHLDAIIEFYKAMIKRVTHMTNTEINTTSSWDFLVGLDYNIAGKHGLKVNKIKSKYEIYK